MEIKLISKKKDKLSFQVKGINYAYANALRRLIMSDVPTLAIEDVEFKKNNSILYDEIIAHRLGLLVLKTNLDSADEKTQVQFTLKAKGPGYVYASDLKSKDAKCKPVHAKTPIVKLLDKQELELTATAVLGTGTEHVKWSPGIVHYVQDSKLTINNKSKLFEKFKDKYPPQAFNKKGELDEKLIITNSLVDACEGVCEDILKVEYSDSDFIFHVEAWGQIDCKMMIMKGVEVFNTRLNNFAKQVKSS